MEQIRLWLIRTGCHRQFTSSPSNFETIPSTFTMGRKHSRFWYKRTILGQPFCSYKTQPRFNYSIFRIDSESASPNSTFSFNTPLTSTEVDYERPESRRSRWPNESIFFRAEPPTAEAVSSEVSSEVEPSHTEPTAGISRDIARRHIERHNERRSRSGGPARGRIAIGWSRAGTYINSAACSLGEAAINLFLNLLVYWQHSIRFHLCRPTPSFHHFLSNSDWPIKPQMLQIHCRILVPWQSHQQHGVIKYQMWKLGRHGG